MKRYLLGIISALLLLSCSQPSEKENNNLPRIAIAGLAIESSTFSPAQTHEEAFHAKTGDSVFTIYPFFSAPDSPIRKRAEWFPTLKGHALPGGIVTREAYESLVTKTLEMLEENLPYDGLFFDIHGAMSVVGLDDPEGDFIVRVREVVGDSTLISTCMDLHGNVSPRLAKHTDLITCYRLAPHEDAMESKKRAVDNLLERLENGKGKPAYKAWIPVPILLPGEKTSTRIDPGKSLYGKVAPAAAQEGVVDAAIWVGYPWADEPRNHAVVMVIGDDKEKVTRSAEELARSFWKVRNEFEFVAPTATLKECLDKAIASEVKPFIISDMGDNPTAGGAGDVTWTLREVLKRPEFKKAEGPSLIYASIPGPELVAQAVEAGEGGQVDALAGADIDDRYAPPIRLSGTVEAIKHGDIHAETEVVVRVGSVQVIVTKKRKPYHHEADFTDLGLNPRETDIVMVKIGYLVPELYNMRADWIMALTPGGVDQDLERLAYKRIQRPMFPFDKDMETPDLTARLIPLSHSPISYPTTGSIERIDPAINELIPEDVKLEIIGKGFDWSEGPVWVAQHDMLLFSDIPSNKVMQWTAGEEVKEYLHPSGYTGEENYSQEPGSNGLLIDNDGNLVLCQHGDRQIARMNAPLTDPAPNFVTIVDRWEGKRFNSPNDAIFDSQGDLYFTDPPYGLPQKMEDPGKEIPFQGVYYFSPRTQKVTLLTDELSRPNGIGLSPDEKTLYVANSDPSRAIWMAYDLENASISNGRIFYDATDRVGTEKGLPDGLKVDNKGNVWATGPGGVWVFTPEGKHLGTVKTGQATANCAFDTKETALYTTADRYLLRLRLN